MMIKTAFKGAASAVLHGPDDIGKTLKGLVGLSITLLAGFCFPVLSILRYNFGERFFLTERIILSLIVQWFFFYTMKFLGWIGGVTSVEGLYSFFVWIDIIMLLHVLKIIIEGSKGRPRFSYDTGRPSPIWNLFRRVPWINETGIKLVLEPLFLFVVSLIVIRNFNPAIGTYLLTASFSLIQLQSLIWRQQRALYLDMTDSEGIEFSDSGSSRLSKPVPIIHNLKS